MWSVTSRRRLLSEDRLSPREALAMIEERPPDFALLDVSLIREKSFAVAERLDSLPHHSLQLRPIGDIDADR